MKGLFFVYCNDSGFELFETLDDALDAANERIQGYLDDAWSEEVTGVCAGKITHRAKMCDQVFPDGEIDEDGIDEAGEYWDPDWDYKCNYKMLPVEIDANQNPVGWVVVGPGGFMSDIETVQQHAVDFKYDMDLELSVNHAGPAHEVLPVYLSPQPAPDVAKLVEALEGLLAITDESLGVSGYHLNGDMAKWCEFDEVDMAEEALALYRQQGGDL